MSAPSKTNWHMTGEELVTCNCAWGCPCQFNALPTHGNCEGWLTCRIDRGNHGDIKLDGVRFSAMVWFPGAVHEGNGTMQVVIDSATSADQRRVLNAILTGLEGGLPFEVIAAVCSNVRETMYAPISFTSNRDARTAVVEIPGIAKSTVEPIKNPISGEEHRAKIVLPNGFEYKEAEMGNAVSFQVTVGSNLRMDYTNTYAQLNRFEWGN
jgi:hypothetical protein